MLLLELSRQQLDSAPLGACSLLVKTLVGQRGKFLVAIQQVATRLPGAKHNLYVALRNRHCLTLSIKVTIPNIVLGKLF